MLHLFYVPDVLPAMVNGAWQPILNGCAVCGSGSKKEGAAMSGSMHLYHHLGLDPQSLDAITDQIVERMNATLPQANATAIATAVKSALDGNFQTLAQELRQMSASLSQQLAADVALIQDSVARVASDVQSIAARLVPGEVVTQADVDAVNAAAADLSSAVEKLDALANPPAP